jgi:hypothetical protein
MESTASPPAARSGRPTPPSNSARMIRTPPRRRTGVAQGSFRNTGPGEVRAPQQLSAVPLRLPQTALSRISSGPTVTFILYGLVFDPGGVVIVQA